MFERACWLVLIAVVAATAGESPAPAPAPAPATATDAPVVDARWHLSDADRTAIDQAFARAIAGGFPDAKGAEVWIGSFTTKVSTGDDSSYSNTSEGLKLRRADGTWLDQDEELTEGATATVSTDGAKLVPLDALAATLREQNQHQVPLDQIEQQFTKMFRADQRPKLAVMIEAMPILMGLGFGQDESTTALHLVRLGVPFSDGILVGLSLQRVFDPTGGAWWRDRGAALSLRADNGFDFAEMQAMHERTDLVLPEPRQVVQRMLHDHFRKQLFADAITSAEAGRLAAVALEVLDDGDRVAQAPAIARLVERAGLPVQAPAEADVVQRLISWNPGRDQEMRVSSSDGETSAEPPIAVEADLPGLFAILGDDRPTRWIDGGVVRGVGDAALRAISDLLCCDPRPLAGRDASAPWTAEERATTVAALQAWWAPRAAKPLDEILGEAIPEMTLADLAALIARTDAARRVGVLDRLVTRWITPPEGDDDDLAKVLAAGKDHAAFAALVDGWPIDGERGVLLATWHQLRGDPVPLDDLIGEIEDPTDEDNGWFQHNELVAMLARFPTAPRLERLRAVIARPLEDPAAAALVMGVLNGAGSWGGSPGGLADAIAGDGDGGAARKAVPLSLLWAALTDQRPATPAMIAQVEQRGKMMAQVNEGNDGKKAEPKPAAADLRICDLAAAAIVANPWQFGITQDHEAMMAMRNGGFDLSFAAGARDERLGELRAHFSDAVRAALAAAKLPDALPGGAAAGDAEAMF